MAEDKSRIHSSGQGVKFRKDNDNCNMQLAV